MEITTYARAIAAGSFWRWQRQEVDLKKGGIVPIANLGRFHALANGITISPTLDRLIAAEELGALDKETAQSLREAFAFIWQVRLDHHAQQISPGLPPDNSFVPTSCRHWHGKSCAKRFAPSPQPSSSSTDLFPSA
jgi:signal-transduction protein with cAMP-binding, CBS, and nucleotidyltransferase domain